MAAKKARQRDGGWSGVIIILVLVAGLAAARIFRFNRGGGTPAGSWIVLALVLLLAALIVGTAYLLTKPRR